MLIAVAVCFVLLLPAFFSDVFAQQSPGDSLVISMDTLSFPSALPDTGATMQTTLKKRKGAIDSKVVYSATDSIVLDLESSKVYMYRDADIKYEKIHQAAGFIELNFKTNILKARPLIDSTGKQIGKPVFSESDQEFTSEQIDYNFKTTKGIIKNVITQEGQGYLHGEVVKKLKDNVSNLNHGGYTTCNLPHPHFSIKFTRAKVIPNNKIVTGPAFLTIEDVPLPLVLPFGLFPNKRGQTSGILIPTYGESRERGFYLENGGYYFGINEYMELKLIGDIYSRGSWALKPTFNYKKRYKYNGSFNFTYAINTEGIRETPNFTKRRDFRVFWSHVQDPRARPKSRFSASVNFVSNTMNKYNPQTTQDMLTNTFSSSISYQTSLMRDKLAFSATVSHSQNTTTRMVNLTAPYISLSANRFYPFRKPGKTSSFKWYDNVSVNYSMTAQNEVNVADSLLFTPAMYNSFRNGMQHKIPLNLSFKLLRYFTLGNSLEYTERWYSKTVRREWVNDTLWNGENYKVGYISQDTIDGFRSARDFSFTSSLNTTLYGLVQFKRGPVRAIRHVLKPSVALTLRPDFGNPWYGYYKTVQSDTLGNMSRYSVFDGLGFRSLYGTPPDGRSGRIGFGLSNNLEMKVRSRSDTITGMKKVVLLESVSLTSSYDLARDTLQWATVNLDARTTLFKKLVVRYTAIWDPYVVTETGKRLNQFEWDVNRRILRKQSTSWNFSFNYDFASGKKKTPTAAAQAAQDSETEEVLNEAAFNPQGFIDWNNPWSFSMRYNLNYTGQYMPANGNIKGKVIQTLGFTGDINVTPKWKVSMSSDYDLKLNKLSYASVNIYRDLHCWEMRLNWIPIGYYKSWNFYIKVKASVLQDLKLTRKKDFRDN